MTKRMTAYLSIGSNIRPQKNIPACLGKLRREFKMSKVSSIYETSPVGTVGLRLCEPKGPEGKRKFWNLAVEIKTNLARPKLIRTLRLIEKKLGRARNANRFAPRPIDIDLVLYRAWRRPGIENLGFVVVPLGEIAPRLKPRGMKFPFGHLARTFYDPDQKIHQKMVKRKMVKKD